jgi:hypothetical protein
MRNDWWKSAAAVAGAFLLVFGVGWVGWTLVRPSSRPAEAAAHRQSLPVTSAPTTVDPTTSPPVPTPTPTPTPTRRVVPRPTATTRPPAAQRPPAPAPKPTPSPGCTPSYAGPKAPLADVRDALTSAAGRQYWVGVVPPPDLTVHLPVITVPVNLMKAVAWQESGWQSTIMSCDGGIGTMQISAGTAKQVNDRFGESFNVNTLSGNTSIGAAYIEWLIMYFGLYYFGQNFDLSTVAAVGPNGTTLKLLDVVVAAYNVGPATLEVAPNTLSIGPVGRTYKDNVIALMNNCVCLTY